MYVCMCIYVYIAICVDVCSKPVLMGCCLLELEDVSWYIIKFSPPVLSTVVMENTFIPVSHLLLP